MPKKLVYEVDLIRPSYEEVKASGYLDYMAELFAPKGLVYVAELPVSQLKFHIYFNRVV